MTDRIRIITPPDILYGRSLKLLALALNEEQCAQLQQHLGDAAGDVDVYFAGDSDDIDWLLQVYHLCDFTIVNVDAVTGDVKLLLSYLVSSSKTFWLTNQHSPVYNRISSNRVYDLSFLSSIEVISEQSQ